MGRSSARNMKTSSSRYAKCTHVDRSGPADVPSCARGAGIRESHSWSFRRRARDVCKESAKSDDSRWADQSELHQLAEFFERWVATYYMEL